MYMYICMYILVSIVKYAPEIFVIFVSFCSMLSRPLKWQKEIIKGPVSS